MTRPSGTPKEPRPSAQSKTSPRHLWIELGLVFGSSAALIIALDNAQLQWGFLGPYLYILVALVFLLLPTLVVERWRGEAAADAGMDYGPFKKSLLWGSAATLITLGPFLAGYHLWQTQTQGLTATPSVSNYARWNIESEGFPTLLKPSNLSNPPKTYVWSELRDLHVWFEHPNPKDRTLIIEDPHQVLSLKRSRGAEVIKDATRWIIQLPPHLLRGGTDLHRSTSNLKGTVQIVADKGRLENAEVLIGASGTPKNLPLSLDFDLWWILNLLMTQLFFVAFPEEYFYRGYIQPTLERLNIEGPKKRGLWRRLGMSRSIVITSALFAVGHLFTSWHWTRLMVFFPSLSFGWLRSRTGGIIAPVIFHAACNSMVELARVHYF